MKNVALMQVYFEGVTMQIPEIWEATTETYNEEDFAENKLSIN